MKQMHHDLSEKLMLLAIGTTLVVVIAIIMHYGNGPREELNSVVPQQPQKTNACNGISLKDRGPLVLTSITGTLTSVSAESAILHPDPIRYHPCDGTPPADRTIMFNGTTTVKQTVFKTAAEMASERLHNHNPLPLSIRQGNQTMLARGQRVIVSSQSNIKFSPSITPTMIEILP